NVRVPAELIIERSGMVPGEQFDWAKSRAGEFDLLDTGAFSSTFIRGSTDTVFIVPGDAPDTGGVLGDEQVDANGDLVPRELDEEVDLKIHVVEAPSQQLRVRAGAEFDPTRLDTALSSRLWLRNLFGPWHHLVLEGRLGYGWLWRDTTDDPTGFYGEALVRYLKPMLGARLLDFRLTARLRDELHPGFHLLEVTTGPGVRSTLAKNLFFDTDLFFRYGLSIDFGPFDDATRDELSLPEDDTFLGPELQSSIVWDERDNPVEALKGHLLALRASFTPGDPMGTHRYLTLGPEARGFLPITESFSIGLRGAAGWAFLGGDDGIPLGPRLFGGGSYGMRGFGRHRLSPTALSCPTAPAPGAALVECELGPVGGLSLVEASLEGRLLPYLKPYGLVAFADVGGAGAEANPFDTGVSMALGAGLRLRIWYLPIAFDAAYRLLRDNEVQAPEHDPFLVFFRIGESF
ncbi:MAG: BamA/TamA family outer membrane protein, partial [Deltaproteobacteria bacterium]|nr:BamA/TamA family outer membrane protein [Deltaproteobacteria bacterium]MBW2537668.1 BamA/TamA family outer membrane protein [Deltaproteobacteria bacterium]